MTKEFKRWIDEQVTLYSEIWNTIMFNAPINSEDEEWLNRKKSGFDEYVKDIQEERLPIEVLNPRKNIPSYIKSLESRYRIIMNRYVDEEINKSKEFVKNRIKQMYNGKNEERN